MVCGLVLSGVSKYVYGMPWLFKSTMASRLAADRFSDGRTFSLLGQHAHERTYDVYSVFGSDHHAARGPSGRFALKVEGEYVAEKETRSSEIAR